MTTQGFTFSTSRLGPGRTGEGGGAGWLYCHLLWPGHDTQHSRGLALTHNSPRLFAVFLACNSCIRYQRVRSHKKISAFYLLLDIICLNDLGDDRVWSVILNKQSKHISLGLLEPERVFVFISAINTPWSWCEPVTVSSPVPSSHLSISPSTRRDPSVAVRSPPGEESRHSLKVGLQRYSGRESLISPHQRRGGMWGWSDHWLQDIVFWGPVPCSSWHCYCLFSLRASWGNE